MTDGFRYDYFQTSDIVELSLFVKNLSEDVVDVEMKERELSVTFKDTGKVFKLSPLSQPINASASKYTIKSMKMEFELVKADKGVTWGGIVAEAEPAQSTQSTRKQTKDWNKIASIEAQDKEEQGDGNPDDFFKKLFAGADDDVRKAMMKSYQESGGTSLSTNWEEVSKGKVESKPPAGIEKKEW